MNSCCSWKVHFAFRFLCITMDHWNVLGAHNLNVQTVRKVNFERSVLKCTNLAKSTFGYGPYWLDFFTWKCHVYYYYAFFVWVLVLLQSTWWQDLFAQNSISFCPNVSWSLSYSHSQHFSLTYFACNVTIFVLPSTHFHPLGGILIPIRKGSFNWEEYLYC